jgi:hypothetical protein
VERCLCIVARTIDVGSVLQQYLGRWEIAAGYGHMQWRVAASGHGVNRQRIAIGEIARSITQTHQHFV